MKLLSYLHVALTTTLNVVLNALTLGRFVWLEGRVRGGVFKNWARRFRYAPRKFARPRSEDEIVSLVKNSRSVRLFGSAHSFNAGVVSDETLVSLDDYSGALPDGGGGANLLTVKGGTRVRDLVALLLKKGLAFEALPSHDAQSIGGILSTDVHGTGRTWGFVSQTVERLKIIDGKGDVHVCAPADDLFKAAIGGVGAVGVIAEVTVKAVPRFNVEQRVEWSTLSEVKNNLDQLLRDNTHFSFYVFPFTKKCQINIWNPTTKPQSPLASFREFVSISIDALLAAWFGNLMAHTGLMPHLSNFTHGVKRGTNLVMESNEAFNRTIYHLHQELEFTVPFAETVKRCGEFVELYEKMYRAEALPYALFEVRFTPAGHDRTLLGAGRERRSAWIDLVLNDSAGFEKYYAAAEALMKTMDARPHMGKFCESLDQSDMARLHGANFTKFLSLAETHDPERKFSNNFTRRVFGR